jgi:hypothetical protein
LPDHLKDLFSLPLLSSDGWGLKLKQTNKLLPERQRKPPPLATVLVLDPASKTCIFKRFVIGSHGLLQGASLKPPILPKVISPLSQAAFVKRFLDLLFHQKEAADIASLKAESPRGILKQQLITNYLGKWPAYKVNLLNKGNE